MEIKIKPKIYKSKAGFNKSISGNDLCQICGGCCNWKKYGHIIYYEIHEINIIQKRNKQYYKYLMTQIAQAIKEIYPPPFNDNPDAEKILAVIADLGYSWIIDKHRVWGRIIERLRDIEGACQQLIIKDEKHYCNIHKRFGFVNKSYTCSGYQCGVIYTILKKDIKGLKEELKNNVMYKNIKNVNDLI